MIQQNPGANYYSKNGQNIARGQLREYLHGHGLKHCTLNNSLQLRKKYGSEPDITKLEHAKNKKS